MQKVAYLTATIATVDSENDTADFTGIGKCPAGVDIPIFYHCEPDSVLRDNGALEGAAGAFSGGDEVIVQCEVVSSTVYKPLRVMGFTDKPKECISDWNEEWGESICENHQWYVQNYDNTERGLCLDPLPEEFSIIGGIIKCDPSAIVVGWNIDRSPNINWSSTWGEPKIKANRYLTLKIATHYNCIDCNPAFVDSTVAMLINTDTQWLQLNFEETTGHPHQSREYYIGDNGGLEQVIDLHSYGLIGSSIRSIKFWVNLLCPVSTKESGGFELDYVRLSNSSA